MTFESPWRLVLLGGVLALVVLYALVQRRRTVYAVRFTNLALLDRVAPRNPGWRRHVPAVAFLLMLLTLVTGFARPAADVRVPRERATVFVAIDTSTSMEATDVEPSRIEAAKGAATGFIEGLPAEFNVGLVTFSGSARVVATPTTDHGSVAAAVEGLDLSASTAIGEAVFSSLDGIRAFGESLRSADADAADPAEAPPARIVLMSDGTNTAGRTPTEAATAATEAGVPVSTIAYGTAEGTITAPDGREIAVPVDTDQLRTLAESTGGTAYTAASGDELEQVYEDIGSSVGWRTERQDVSAWFIGAGLLAALAAAGASLAWFSRLP